MTVFVSDTFTDNDDVLLQNHTPDTGGSWTIIYGSANIVITSNTAYWESVGGSADYKNGAAPGNAKYDITFDLTFSDKGILYIYFRYVDASNYYRAYLRDTASGASVFSKKVAGVYTQLDSASFAMAGAMSFKAGVLDDSKDLYIDDLENPVLTSADNTIEAAGSIGFGIGRYSGTTTVDNLVADDVGEAEAETASMQPIHHWWPR